MKTRMSWLQPYSPEFLVEMIVYAIIIYVIYWVIKKGVWALKKRELTATEKRALAIAEILIYGVIFALRSRNFL